MRSYQTRSLSVGYTAEEQITKSDEYLIRVYGLVKSKQEKGMGQLQGVSDHISPTFMEGQDARAEVFCT